jgi:hypothetical protein
MKTTISILLLAGLVTCLCFCSLPLAAQVTKSQMYLVGCDVVNPSMETKYLQTVKEQVAMFDKYKFPYAWSVYATNDYCYYYLFSVNDFTDIGNVFNAALPEFAGRAGNEWKALYAKFSGVVQSTSFFVLTFTPELSYIPTSPRLKPGVGNVVIIDAWYAMVGKEEEFENHIKELFALMKKRNITDGWNAFVGGIGTEQLYAFVTRDTSMADFWTHNAEMWKTLGKERSALIDQLKACTRKREWKFAWYQPELGYTPKEKKQTK